MIARRAIAFSLLLLFVAVAAEASWYDDYDAGLAAIRKGDWSSAAQKMSAAIKGNPKESDRARTYSTIMINYHPFYYRGVAYLNMGRYDEAIADLERTSGPGPENLGSIEALLGRAKKLQSAASEPSAPEPARVEPARPAPAVVQPPVQQAPAVPQIDPALRQRAAAALAATKQKIQDAQRRQATSSPQYSQAMSMFTDASTRNASARSNDDLNGVITIAENAGDLAELAAAPNVARSAPPAVPSRPAAATDAVLSDTQRQLRRALENYFNGEFELATRDFQSLSSALPSNAWVFAFLGASQYSQYAFEADPRYRDAAIRSFRKARQLRNWRGGLPEKYFSKRIRKAFEETGR